MAIMPHSCEFCGQKFYSKIGVNITEEEERKEKYDHLRAHPEYVQKINKLLDNYPNIKKWVPVGEIPEYPKKNIHAFVDVVYDSETFGEYCDKLLKFDALLSKYADTLDKQEKNVVQRKTHDNFFSFLAELEVIDAIGKTFSKNPEIVKSTHVVNNDIILENRYFEVKCPMETKKPLNEYITDWKNQRQLANIGKDKISVLVIKTDYKYADFPVIAGGLERVLANNNKSVFWNCCITYNNFNKKGDVIGLDIAEKDIEKLTQLKENLIWA